MPAFFSNKSFDVHQETVGFEKTFLSGNASIGVRVPFLQSPDENSVGDVTVIAKSLIFNDTNAGFLLSGGLAVTLPTAPNSESTLLQPFVGFDKTLFGDFSVNNFTSIVFPVGSNHADTILSDDIALNYFLYHGPPGQFVSAVVPTIGAHINVDLTHSNESHTDVTLGSHFQIFGRGVLGVALNVPVTGPKPFDAEGIVNFNFRF